MNDSPPLLRPTPRQPSELTPDSLSAESSVAATPVQTPSDVSPTNSERPAVKPATRNGSVFNLTSSTLSGIYARSGDESLREGSATPGGAGAQTPARRASLERKASMVVRTGPRPKGSPRGPSLILSFRGYVLRLVPRMTLLFGVGVAYGILITQLHMSQRVAPVIVENIHRASWRHLALWGMAGIFLGGLLPWIDMLWEQAFGGKEGTWKREEKPDSATSETADSNNDKGPPSRREYGLDADWNPAVRSIGAFIGIAFAIRKLPWQSTLQISLTLALVNPVLWYLVDRSKPGFILSTIIGISGTVLLLGVNPEIVPAPAAASPRVGDLSGDSKPTAEVLHIGSLSHETIGLWTWIASVLFCSSVCFGNIGRRLARTWNTRKA